MKKLCALLCLFMTFFSVPLLAENQTHPFVAGSLNEILKTRQGKPFILMFWSLDCASCMRDLDALAASMKKHPKLDLVMVSTDEAEFAGEVSDMLAKHELKQLESWIFSESNTQRLRYEVDSSWYGELPRSYFYDAGHNRLPVSGAITAEHIDAWVTAVSP
ncbi:thioredoxin-like domain-containing protein [Methylocaldum sp.]|uniref:thioredoxin-like domain-containing protein n=1 Tax=Methylocaldum sp. TaxID=1969727 RepID=UPI002D69AB2E|nr:thioredoxin-like domain-containing protein [Methylocaldum sp.]HYE34021.1 thioredoxin-like domain-containing protein [Methylocaldum sp.]